MDIGAIENLFKTASTLTIIIAITIFFIWVGYHIKICSAMHELEKKCILEQEKLTLEIAKLKKETNQ